MNLIARNRFLFFLFLGLQIASLAHAQQADGDPSALVFAEKKHLLDASANPAARCLAVARSFVGTPYVHGCLDRHNGTEQLVINLRELDCWTFVEYCTAFALNGRGDYAGFKEKVQELRYWGGQINGYGSRIHYFSGWILQAEKTGHLSDLTASLGGQKLKKTTAYLSKNPKKYPKLRDAQQLQYVIGSEKRINAHAWHYIPKSKIRQVESRIQDGDLILLTSSKPFLDIAHEGFAIRMGDGRVHLLHASSTGGKVLISPRPLAEYCARAKSQSGIMVARLR